MEHFLGFHLDAYVVYEVTILIYWSIGKKTMQRVRLLERAKTLHAHARAHAHTHTHTERDTERERERERKKNFLTMP